MSGDRKITCAEARERLPLLYYEADDGDAIALARHLDGCAECAAAWEETRRALDAVRAEDAFPREREVDWEAVARATVARARAAAAPRPLRFRPGRRAAFGAALAAAAALVVTLGLWPRDSSRPTPLEPPADGTAGLLRESLARQAAARSLREARALLVDLMQAPVRCRRDDGTLDIAIEKARSRVLLRRLALHQGALAGPEDARIAELMGQMESLLLQVSTLEDCAGPNSLDDLRAAIDRRQILLRVDLVTRDIEGGMRRA